MKTIRLSLSVPSVTLLAAGFVVSMLQAPGQAAADYAARVDQPAVQYVALLILLSAILLSFVRDKSDEEKT